MGRVAQHREPNLAGQKGWEGSLGFQTREGKRNAARWREVPQTRDRKTPLPSPLPSSASQFSQQPARRAAGSGPGTYSVWALGTGVRGVKGYRRGVLGPGGREGDTRDCGGCCGTRAGRGEFWTLPGCAGPGVQGRKCAGRVRGGDAGQKRRLGCGPARAGWGPGTVDGHVRGSGAVRYPLYQLGNPQLRVFRTNFFIRLVRPGTAQPEDTVQFRIPMEFQQEEGSQKRQDQKARLQGGLCAAGTRTDLHIPRSVS
nr:39S ribosomal protein L23, mitochondrial isoform X2 [Equus caballus]